MTLHDLNPGMSATITGYQAGKTSYRNKLLSLGLTRGTKIKVLHQAPLGDPVNLEVRGFHLSLRRSEASIIEVSVI